MILPDVRSGHRVIPCPACEATGHTTDPDSSAEVTCILCRGTCSVDLREPARVLVTFSQPARLPASARKPRPHRFRVWTPGRRKDSMTEAEAAIVLDPLITATEASRRLAAAGYERSYCAVKDYRKRMEIGRERRETVGRRNGP